MNTTETLYVDNRGTTLEMLKTIDDCDKAMVWLTDAIVSIQNTGTPTPAAKKALRFRRLALNRVQEKRAQLKKADLLAVVERLAPDVVAEARRMVA